METRPLTAAERVAQLIKVLEITSYQFGKATGLSHQTISNVLTGKNRPSLDTLEAIAARYPDTAVWLLTGTGEPRTGSVLTPRPVAEPAADYTSAGSTEQTLYISVLKEQVADLKADKSRLLEQNQDLHSEVKLLLGKSPGSSDAAGLSDEAPADPHAPTFSGGAVPQPRLRVQGLVRYAEEAAELSN